MTDKPTPTDAELEALLLGKLPASKHYIRPVIEKMVAAMQAAIDKWGQPAQAAEPVANVEVRSSKNGTTLTLSPDFGAFSLPEGLHKLYPAPQPVAREPLSHAQAKALVLKYSNDPLNLVFQVELAHGINGGQHGPNT